MAGHRVEVVQEPANLTEVLGRTRHDIILAERADASAVRTGAAAAGASKPSIVGVLEDPSAATLTAARQEFEYVLKTPDSLAHILNLLDDVMQARHH